MLIAEVAGENRVTIECDAYDEGGPATVLERMTRNLIVNGTIDATRRQAKETGGDYKEWVQFLGAEGDPA